MNTREWRILDYCTWKHKAEKNKVLIIESTTKKISLSKSKYSFVLLTEIQIQIQIDLNKIMERAAIWSTHLSLHILTNFRLFITQSDYNY